MPYKDKERLKEYNRRYYLEHKETLTKRYDREKNTIAVKKWRQKNREKVNEYAREYRKRKKLEQEQGV